MEIDIGIGKTARQAYGLDDIAIVPSRRTRDPDDVDITWQLDGFRFALPMMGSAMDGALSPATAAAIGRLGGLGVLNLEGLWTRYEDPEPYFEEIAELPSEKATRRMQEIYLEPIKAGTGRPASRRDEGREVRHRRQPHPAAGTGPGPGWRWRRASTYLSFRGPSCPPSTFPPGSSRSTSSNSSPNATPRSSSEVAPRTALPFT